MDEKNDDKSKSQNLLSCLEKPSGIDAIVIVIAIGDESLRDLPAWLEEIRFNNQIMSASKNSEGEWVWSSHVIPVTRCRS